MFNQIFSKKVIVPFFQLLGIIAIFQWIIFPGLTAADTIVNIFSVIIAFFTGLALYYIVSSWFEVDVPKEPIDTIIGETELDYVPKKKPIKMKPATKSKSKTK